MSHLKLSRISVFHGKKRKKARNAFRARGRQEVRLKEVGQIPPICLGTPAAPHLRLKAADVTQAAPHPPLPAVECSSVRSYLMLK